MVNSLKFRANFIETICAEIELLRFVLEIDKFVGN